MDEALTVKELWPKPLVIKVNSSSDGFDIEIFHLISSYIDLIETMRVVATKGLAELAAYRSGVLDANAEAPIRLADRDYEAELVKFAQSAICYNIKTYIDIITNAMIEDMKSGPHVNPYNFVTKEMATQITRLINFRPMRNAYRKDIITALYKACYYQAYSRAEASMSVDHIYKFFAFIKTADFEYFDFKEEFLPLLKAVFYIACAYYKVSPEDLITLRKLPDFQNALKICDTTLAAVPPSPVMLNTCADKDVPPSTNAIVYMYSIENALRKLPHVKFPELAERIRNLE